MVQKEKGQKTKSYKKIIMTPIFAIFFMIGIVLGLILFAVLQLIGFPRRITLNFSRKCGFHKHKWHYYSYPGESYLHVTRGSVYLLRRLCTKCYTTQSAVVDGKPTFFEDWMQLSPGHFDEEEISKIKKEKKLKEIKKL